MTSPSIVKYMTPHPHTVSHGERVATAYDVMSKYGVRHLPVLDNGRLTGIVSQRDLFFLEALHHMDPELAKVEEAMTAAPFTVPPTALVADVARAMAEHKYGAVPVMDGDRLVGIFTTNDALRAVVGLLDTIAGSRSRPARRRAGRPTHRARRTAR